jgi:hypothetical protein
MSGYESYEDWYDNGPGSENFKRSLRKPVQLKIFTEEYYRSEPMVNMDDDMVRITIHLPLTQWRPNKQEFINLLHKIRLGQRIPRIMDG